MGLIHSRYNFSKRVLALLQRAASMVVARLQRATIEDGGDGYVGNNGAKKIADQ